jgi:hypothetical protein
VSAWTTTLSGILQPSVQLVDQENGVEMCRYTHEDKEGTDTHTAVIMCMLHRANPSEKWKLSSIGQICNGRASNYSELRGAIRLLGITTPLPVAKEAKKKELMQIDDDNDDHEEDDDDDDDSDDEIGAGIDDVAIVAEVVAAAPLVVASSKVEDGHI